MRRGRLICGMITSLIFFAIGLVQPADALVVRDIETCVRVCIIQYNRYGDIYAAMECIGRCSRYAPRHPVAQYGSRETVIHDECCKAARALST
jgi:hypothetical protein